MHLESELWSSSPNTGCFLMCYFSNLLKACYLIDKMHESLCSLVNFSELNGILMYHNQWCVIDSRNVCGPSGSL
jgi:hypothetical protein